jgi:hypothetical protein
MTEAEYLDWLRESCGYLNISATGDGNWVAIREMLFSTADIIRGEIGDMIGHSEEWRYADTWGAVVALTLWKEIGFESEPEAWIRHVPSGRRRPNGDISREYVAP